MDRCVFAVLLVSAVATAKSPALPQHRGAPLHPACVTSLLNQDDGRLSLKKCGKDPGTIEISGAAVTFTPKEPSGGREMDRYEVLGLTTAGWMLSYLWNGGGTGYFSGVVEVRIDGDTLVRVQSYGAGDRCNGGLVSAELADGKLTLTRWGSPYDVIEARSTKTSSLEAYKDLESSAMSCAAKLVYRGSEGRSDLVRVELADDVEDREGWTENYRYQSCYNALQRSWIADGKGTLDLAGLDAFTAAFRTRCVESPKE